MKPSSYITPEGLFGLLQRTALVRGVSARSTSARLGRKPPSAAVTTTGTPRHMRVISG